MKSILFLSIILFFQSVNAQFSRSYLHSTYSGNNSFTSYLYLDKNGQTTIASICPDSSQNLVITTQKLNTKGDLTDYKTKLYFVQGLNYSSYTTILGVFEQSNYRYYVIKSLRNSKHRIIWLKIDTNTEDIVSSYISDFSFKSNFIHSQFNNNEIVTYIHEDGTDGLVRLAMDATTFIMPSKEIVDNTNMFNLPDYRTRDGYKAGFIFMIDNKEYVVVGSSGNIMTIYIRNGANQYDRFSTNIDYLSSTTTVNSFLISDTIVITNNKKMEYYNKNGNLIKTQNFSVNENLNTSQMIYKNNQFYAFRVQQNMTYTYDFFRFDKNLNRLDSVRFDYPIILSQSLSLGDTTLIFGTVAWYEKGLQQTISGQTSPNDGVQGAPIFCERFLNVPTLEIYEYGHVFTSENKRLKARLGIGIKLARRINSCSILYDEKNVVYYVSENYIGVKNSTDVIHNATSSSVVAGWIKEFPGPYTSPNKYDVYQENKYNRIYHVSTQMIKNHLDSLMHGSSTYIPSWEILEWPAHGDISKGQAHKVAPFVDINHNGIYEPMLGDYPFIYGNDCFFSISHYRDNNTSKPIEFQSFIYTQRCDTSSIYEDVLFRKLHIISRGMSLDTLYFGLYQDGDVGGSADDYVGTNVDLGMTYTYNADLYDSDYQGYIGFHDTLAAQGFMVLKGFKQKNDSEDNSFGILFNQSVNGFGFDDGIIDNEYKGLYASNCFFNGPTVGSTTPNTLAEWKNLYNGLYRFGDTMYYGKTGVIIPDSNAIPARYAFPNKEDVYHFNTNGIDPGFYWSEFNLDGNGSASLPIDRQIFSSFGSGALAKNDTLELDYAFLVARDNAVSTSIFSPVEKLFEKGKKIRTAFLSNLGPCETGFNGVLPSLSLTKTTKEENLVIYPNPTNNSIYILTQSDKIVSIFNTEGKLLKYIEAYKTGEEIDLIDLKSGVFIVQIQGEQSSIIRKIIKL